MVIGTFLLSENESIHSCWCYSCAREPRPSSFRDYRNTVWLVSRGGRYCSFEDVMVALKSENQFSLRRQELCLAFLSSVNKPCSRLHIKVSNG